MSISLQVTANNCHELGTLECTSKQTIGVSWISRSVYAQNGSPPVRRIAGRYRRVGYVIAQGDSYNTLCILPFLLPTPPTPNSLHPPTPCQAVFNTRFPVFPSSLRATLTMHPGSADHRRRLVRASSITRGASSPKLQRHRPRVRPAFRPGGRERPARRRQHRRRGEGREARRGARAERWRRRVQGGREQGG